MTQGDMRIQLCTAESTATDCHIFFVVTESLFLHRPSLMVGCTVVQEWNGEPVHTNTSSSTELHAAAQHSHKQPFAEGLATTCSCDPTGSATGLGVYD
mmetsp:Transcript_44127/g.74331  ORF Transcript_44127/g.74331 Transcript_44127/m.74331 type:complete len:98 (+) Transcript_44127:558-851(+)